MDDMKKLVEKYKRELMEYSKAAPAPEKLSFPEMLPDEAEPVPQSPKPPAPQQDSEECGEPECTPVTLPAELSKPIEISQPDGFSQPKKAPRIVGYSDDQSAMNALEKYFSDMGAPAQGDTQPEEPETERPAFNELPPQFTEEAPQYDFTNSAVSPENNVITDATEPEQPSQFPRSGENTTAEPGTIENIGAIPESGQSPDEQLGRRSFENRQTPVNSRDDIKPLVQSENDDFPKYAAEPEYADLDEFLKANIRQGFLRFRTYTARNALPVPDARVTVTKVIGGERHTFYDLTTDMSGQTKEVSLPAPSSSLSQTPDCSVQPYSLYDADITARGYDPVSIRNLPIFEGILSVQRAALIPAPERSSGEVITEKEPDLTEVSDA